MPLQTPFHELTSSAGPRFEPQDGWLIPADFGDRRGEYEQTCRRAAIFDISHHGQVELVGRDAGKFLHNLCTNDVLKLAIGDGCEAFLTTSQAKTVAYVLVYRGQAEQADAIFQESERRYRGRLRRRKTLRDLIIEIGAPVRDCETTRMSERPPHVPEV